MNFKAYPWASNYYKCSIIFREKEYNSVDEVYQEYKDKADIQNILYIATALKFLQNEDLKIKLLTLEFFDDTIIAKRLKDIKETLISIS